MIEAPYTRQTPLPFSNLSEAKKTLLWFGYFVSAFSSGDRSNNYSVSIFFQCHTWCIRNCHWGGACCSNHGDHARDKAWRYMATKAEWSLSFLALSIHRYSSQELSQVNLDWKTAFDQQSKRCWGECVAIGGPVRPSPEVVLCLLTGLEHLDRSRVGKEKVWVRGGRQHRGLWRKGIKSDRWTGLG